METVFIVPWTLVLVLVLGIGIEILKTFSQTMADVDVEVGALDARTVDVGIASRTVTVGVDFLKWIRGLNRIGAFVLCCYARPYQLLTCDFHLG